MRYSRLNHQKYCTVTDNPPIIIYVNKAENRIRFRIKTRYYQELLTPEAMKLLGSTKSKITKDKNGETMPHLEITKVELVHCIVVNNGFPHDLTVLYIFVPIKLSG